jgi:alanine dehydrogenase
VAEPGALVLTRRDVAALLTVEDCIAAVERAFRLHAQGRSLAPGVLGVHAAGGGFHVKAAGLELGRAYFAAKTNANFPDNPARRGLPAIQGLVLLFDAASGEPLAVLDSIEITIQRTGAATAVAAKHLARPGSRVATIAGCGNQGAVQLRALQAVCPLERAWAHDLDRGRAEGFARRMSAALGIEVVPAARLGEAAAQSDIVVTCTPARRPILGRDDVRPGTFVAGVGADDAEKSELDPALLASSTVVVDLLEQCERIGDLHHALAAGVMTRERVHAELGEVVAGVKPGRRSENETIVFDSTGTALQDVAAAAAVYERARASGRGTAVDFGAAAGA